MRKYLIIISILSLFLPHTILAERLYQTGFELQSVTSGMEWDTTTNSPTTDTTTKRSGAAALRCNVSATTATVRQIFYASEGHNNNVSVRFYLYIATAPAAISTIMLTRGNNDSMAIRLNADRTLELWHINDGVQIGSDSSALALNTWYRIEYIVRDRADLATFTATTTAYIDGVQFAEGPPSVLGVDKTPEEMTIGCITSGTYDLYFDDIAINDDTGTLQLGLPGAGSIVNMYPDSAGDNDMSTTTDAWNLVDEKPTPDEFTTQAWLDAANDILDVNMESSATAGITSDDTITLVGVNIREHEATAASANYGRRIKSQASGIFKGDFPHKTHNDLTFQTNGESTPKLPFISYIDPQAGGAWTPTLLDSMQIGASTTDATPDLGITALWATVEYVDGAGGGAAAAVLSFLKSIIWWSDDDS